jgi:amino acid transporter
MSFSQKKLILIIIGLFLVGAFFVPYLSHAQLDTNQLKALGNATYGQEATEKATSETYLAETIGGIIKMALGFLGLILVVLIIYGGFLWMTAGGNEEQVKKAKKFLENAIIGLIIVILAYSITYFVIDQLVKISKGTT